MATKVGVIGAGGMLQYHAAGFKQAGAEIIAVADPAPGAAQKAATAKANEALAKAKADAAKNSSAAADKAVAQAKAELQAVEAKLAELELEPANYNGSGQIVAAGSVASTVLPSTSATRMRG